METLSGTGEEYTCDNCGAVHEKTWSDEEAMAEAESLYPAEDLEAEEPGIVCDSCFQVIMAWAQTDMPEHLLQPYDWAIERADGEAAPHQIMWIERERARGALVWLAGVDFDATPEAFWTWYQSRGLCRTKGTQ